MGARAATALRRAHLSAPLPRPISGDRSVPTARVPLLGLSEPNSGDDGSVSGI